MSEERLKNAEAEVMHWSDKLSTTEYGTPAFNEYKLQLEAARRTYNALLGKYISTRCHFEGNLTTKVFVAIYTVHLLTLLL